MKLSRYKFFQSNFFECLLHLAFIIGTVVILFGFGYLTMQGLSDINWYDSAYLRFACILTIVGVVYTVQEWMWNVYRADEHTKWWNIGAKPDQPDWEDVRKMTMGAFEDDPIDYGQKNG